MKNILNINWVPKLLLEQNQTKQTKNHPKKSQPTNKTNKINKTPQNNPFSPKPTSTKNKTKKENQNEKEIIWHNWHKFIFKDRQNQEITEFLLGLSK